jgi:cyclopropane-fatty-acyl-phospholipid synthase
MFVKELRDGDLQARVEVRSARAWPRLLRGSTGLADAYMDGLWTCDDLVSLVRIGARRLPALDAWRRPFAAALRLARRAPDNSRAGSRRNIAAHYDLGNAFFALFLDETMTYSCAAFDRPDMSLGEAQEAKLERACRKLELTEDDHLLEIGTGWGSLAVHAASRYGCRVTTTTISKEQQRVALERVLEAGLEARVTVLLEDYRDLRGRFDKLASIEMIEAVGWQGFAEYFRRCGELLHPHGLMLLQAITIDDRAYEVEKDSRSFIKTYIFPGGGLPSMEMIGRCVVGETDMSPVTVEDMTPFYPETLRRWREGFLANADRAAELGYDRRFQRLWELYLSWCEAGFRERRIGDVQLLLGKPAASRPDQRRQRRATLAPALARVR